MVHKQLRSSSRPDRDQEVSPLALAGLGVQFFAAILLFAWAGNWLDDRFDMSPLFLLAGVFVGGGGTFYSGYRRLTVGMRKVQAVDDTGDESDVDANKVDVASADDGSGSS